MPPATATKVTNDQLQQLAAQVEAAAGQDLPFLTLLIELMAKLVGGVSGAVFVLREDQPSRLVTVYPMAPGRHVQVEPDRVEILRDCVQRCEKAGQLSVYRIAMGNSVYHAICTPLESETATDGIAVVLAPDQDQERIQPFLAHLQWAARLYKLHLSSRGLRRQLRENAGARRALSVLTAAQQAGRFHESCMAVCNALSVELNASRVAIGWARGSSIRLVAMSDTDNVDRRQELSEAIASAMEECMDQGRAVAAPADHFQGEDQWLQQVVSRCHHELATEQEGVVSVPLRHGDEIGGVLTAERPRSRPFEGSDVTQFQVIADLVAPALADRHRGDRPAAVQLWQDLRTLAGRVIGPEHVGLKLVALTVSVLLIASCFVKWNYRVEAPFVFEAREKRVYASPYTGHIEEVFARNGDPVKAGDPLVRMDARPLELMRDGAESQLAVAIIDHRRSLGGSPDDAERYKAMMRVYEVERDLYARQIADAHIVAVEDGVVVTGDWQERKGVRVELGQTLFEVAPLHGSEDGRPLLRAMIRVDERDIDQVRLGGTGALAARGNPSVTVNFTVTRVVPVGVAHEGGTFFPVYCELEREEDWMRPGFEGVAKIDVASRRVIWIMTHKLVDFLRLALWW
ncbi:MAG: hypothetical protein CMJ18_25660 [Phycisphaeraceae bacterium]|nr:hypothetical protein [Phycisphaeraceae bacterium]